MRYYTVKEVAEWVNLTPHTIRFYSKEGLFPAVERSATGVRMFKRKDIDSVFMIECLKKSGLSIKDIKNFTDWCMEGDSTIEQRLAMFKARKEEVEAQITALQDTLEVIKYKCWYYETAKEAGTVSIHDNMDVEKMPETIKRTKEKIAKIHEYSPSFA